MPRAAESLGVSVTALKKACRRLGLRPSEVLAVEDSFTGATSALAAGLHCAGLGLEMSEASGRLRRIDGLGELMGLVP